MKIKKGFILRSVAGNNVVIATGEASKTFKGMIKLNDTGAIIWNGIAKGKSLEEIGKEITDKYEVDSEKAMKDIETQVEKMRQEGFIEE